MDRELTEWKQWKKYKRMLEISRDGHEASILATHVAMSEGDLGQTK